MAYNNCQLLSPEENCGTGRKTQKRGKNGDVRQRVRILTRKKCLPLPSIALAHVQSQNNVDKLQARVSYIREFRDACVLAFTETWILSLILMDSEYQYALIATQVRRGSDS